MRRSAAILLASLAVLLSSTSGITRAPPAHAASAAAATAAASSAAPSLRQRLNPFRTRSADEMIDSYVRDRLFADDEYDPVESAYREAFADYAGGGAGRKDDASTASSGETGAYPSLLAETAGSALGKQRSVSSVLSSSAGASSRGLAADSPGGGGKGDGITSVLIRASDFLQKRLRVSASVSYYILAAGGIAGVCFVPGMVAVAYQGIQRMQIDRGEMKMFGKISDMDATAKKGDDDDDDDDEE